MPLFRKNFRNYFTVYNLFLIAAILLFIGVRLRHINISFERDEGEYAYAGQEILRGGLPYKDFYNMKMPGVYYIMAFLFRLFGDSVYTVKLSLLFINLTSAFFIFLTAKKLFGKDTGIAAAAIFLLFCLSYSAQGWTANAEHYVVFFACIGLYFAVLARQKDSNIFLFFSGAVMMLALICKQHGIGFLMFPGFWFMYINFKSEVSKRWSEINFKSFLPIFQKYAVQMFFYGLGCALPFSGMIFYFWHFDILPSFYYLTFQYAQAYTGIKPMFLEIWQFRPVFWDAFGFWFLIFVLFYFDIRKKIKIGQDGFFPILFICCFASVSIGWYYRPHYFQLLFPVAAMMSAWVIVHLDFFWSAKWLTPTRYIVFSFAGMLVMQQAYFFSASSEFITKAMYKGDFFNEEKEIGTHINSLMSTPNEKIGLVGCEPEVFYYSKRQSASGFIYVYPLLEKQCYATAMFQQFVKEIETVKPEILVYVQNINDASLDEDKVNLLNQWFADFSKGYNIVAQSYLENGISKMDWHSENKMRVSLDSTITLIYKIK